MQMCMCVFLQSVVQYREHVSNAQQRSALWEKKPIELMCTDKEPWPEKTFPLCVTVKLCPAKVCV